MLSHPDAVQPSRRLSGGPAPSWQRAQPGGLGRTSVAGDRAPAANGEGSRVSGRRGLCQAGDLRGIGGTGCQVRHPHSFQQQLGTGYYRTATASGGQAQREAAGGVQGLSLPSRELEDGPAGGCKGRASFWRVVPASGFMVTNLTLPSRAVVRFYNKRGTAEQWIKEGKQAVKMTRLSCHRFRSN